MIWRGLEEQWETGKKNEGAVASVAVAVDVIGFNLIVNL